jgi:hypothetical protein
MILSELIEFHLIKMKFNKLLHIIVFDLSND